MKRFLLGLLTVFCVCLCIGADGEAKEKLDAPEIMVKNGGYNKLVIQWDEVEDAEKCRIFRSESIDGEFEKIAVVSAKKAYYIDEKVKCGKTYYYMVAAVDGKKSEVVAGYTKPQKINFTDQCKTYRAKQVLKWSVSKGSQGYEIYRAETGSDVYELVKTIPTKTKIKWVDKTVVEGKTYNYKIRPYTIREERAVYGVFSKVYKRKKIKTGWQYENGYKLYYDDEGQLVQDVEHLIGKQKKYVLKVNKRQQIVTVYAKDGKNGFIIPVKAFVCSPGHPTPTGTFYTQVKYRWKLMEGGSWAQWSTRITGPFLFHSVIYGGYQDKERLYVSAYNILGQTASLGCVRLTAADAKWIYDNCELKTKVVIYNSDKKEPFDKPKSKKLPSWHTWDPTDPTCKKLCKKHGCHQK